MRRHPLLSLSGLAAMVVGMTLVAMGFSPALANSDAGCRTFTVTPGSWLHTGIQLKARDTYRVTATGTMWRKADKSDQWGPNGYYTLGFMGFGLQGKVGASGRSTSLGSDGGGTADQSGELLLAMAFTYEPKADDAKTIHGAFAVTLVAPCTPPATAAPANDPAVNAFMALVPVLQHPRCANCHGGIEVTDPGLGSARHPGGYFPIVDDRLPGGDQCLECHTDLNGAWRQPLPGGMAWWGRGTPAQLCVAFKQARATPAELIQHLLTDDLVSAGFEGTRGGAIDSSNADPPPLSQTQFVKGVIAWMQAIGATNTAWPTDPKVGCPQ